MAREPIEISLGGRAYSIRPTTLGQLEQLDAEIARAGALGQTRGSAILRIALSRDHAETAEALNDLEVDFPEMTAGVNAILRLAGYLPSRPKTTDAPAG